VVVPLEYDNVGCFKEGLVTVKKGEKYGIVDISGNIVVPIVFDYVGSHLIEGFKEGLAWVQQDGLWGIIANTAIAEIENPDSYPTIAEYIAKWQAAETAKAAAVKDEYIAELEAALAKEKASLLEVRDGLAEANAALAAAKAALVASSDVAIPTPQYVELTTEDLTAIALFFFLPTLLAAAIIFISPRR